MHALKIIICIPRNKIRAVCCCFLNGCCKGTQLLIPRIYSSTPTSPCNCASSNLQLFQALEGVSGQHSTMGIPGLTTFIAQYEAKYNEIIYVRECPVVVDGYNLMFTLYLGRKRPLYAHLVGGDFIGFAKDVRDYFQNLKNCQITPLVILDGAIDEGKMATLEKRLQKLISENVKEDKPGKFYTPLGIYNVFLEVMEEQNIHVFKTKLEADDTIAFIASKLACPVLSSDSDFQIYPNLTAIPLNAVEFRKVTLKSGVRASTLTAKIVPLKKLCQKVFSFKDSRLIPLAALVLGNDRIPVTTFQNFLNTKHEKYSRIEAIFKWFASQANYDRALRTMMESIKEVERSEIQKMIVSIVSNYMGESGEMEVWNMVQKLKLGTSQIVGVKSDSKIKRDASKFVISQRKDPKLASAGNTSNADVLHADGNIIQVDNRIATSEKRIMIPDWFMEGHYLCKFPDQLLKIMINQLIVFYPQVEPPSLPSSHDFSKPILQIIAGILLVASTSEVSILARRGTQAFRETVTINSKCFPQISSVSPKDDSRFGNREEMIFEIFQLSLTERNLVSNWPTPTKLVLISLLYFIKQLSKREAPAIAVGVFLSFLRPTFMSNGKQDQADTPGLSSDLGPAGLIKNQRMTTKLVEFYKRFGSVVLVECEYKIRRVFHYSQFQCLLYYASSLNNLLGNPFKPPKIQTLDSFLVYNVMESALNQFEGDIPTFLTENLLNEMIPSIFERLFEAAGCNFKKFVKIPKKTAKKTQRERNTKTVDVAGLNQFAALSLE